MKYEKCCDQFVSIHVYMYVCIYLGENEWCVGVDMGNYKQQS